jgi:hypothetical protein
MKIYTDAVKLLRERRLAVAAELGQIDRAVKALGGIRTKVFTTGRRKPGISKAGRARIAAAQRARWKNFRATQKSSARRVPELP